VLRVECLEPAIVHWSADRWQSSRDDGTRDGGCGVHYLDLPTNDLVSGSRVDFTFRWSAPERWEGTDYCVTVGAPG